MKTNAIWRAGKTEPERKALLKCPYLTVKRTVPARSRTAMTMTQLILAPLILSTALVKGPELPGSNPEKNRIRPYDADPGESKESAGPGCVTWSIPIACALSSLLPVSYSLKKSGLIPCPASPFSICPRLVMSPFSEASRTV